ncbi:MAG: hypothetical protein NXI24_17010 [bacterium]|nr:hypothetical protein [bacterium]
MKQKLRTWSFRFLASLALAAAVYCGNTFVSASCQRDCDDQNQTCLLTGALFQTTSNGESSDFFSLLFLNCQSALYVCEDTCGGAVGRL